MKRLRVGDKFWSGGGALRPYTVRQVLPDHYIVQQTSSGSEKYGTETIHALFTQEDEWTLERKAQDMFTDNELFTI